MTQITPRHAAILERRGLDLDLLVRLGVASCDRDGGEWIMIPFLKSGVVVNRKYRTIDGPKRFSQDAGALKCFWNYDAITDPTLAHEPLIITEGEFDAAAAMQAGFPRVVSVPDGAPAESIANDNDSRKYSYLLDAERDLKDVKEIILAVDTDPAGSNLLLDLGLRLGRTRCKWVRYPKAKGETPACKDLNDALRLHGIEGVKRSIARADWLKIDGFYRMSDLPPIEEKQIHEIGFPVLDYRYKIRRGDFCVVTGIPGHGKALSLDTPIATPSGWTTMGRIAVGDEVFDECGRPCRVVAATPVMLGRPCFKLQFSGGAELVADAEHQWLTVSEPARRSVQMARKKRAGREETMPRGTDQRHKMTRPGIVTTAQIATSLTSQGKWNHQVDNAQALELPAARLPIPPYALGAWLGDGNSDGGGLTCFDDEILVAVGAENLVVRAQATPGRHTIRHITPTLRRLGVLGNKHIPQVYLRASKEQRLALLRGLMDTDGHCGRDGVCEFTNVNLALARGTYELVASLGLRPNWAEGRATLRGRDCGPKYRIQFSSPFPVFTVARKLARQRSEFGRRNRTSYRTIIGCDPVPSVPVRCIQVDSPSHLYLAGAAMTPTHNSTVLTDIACRKVTNHRWSVAFASFEQSPQIDHRRNLRTWFNRKKVIYQSDEDRAKADTWIDRWFSFICPGDEDEVTLEWVLDRASASIVRHGADMLIIDPWNEMDHSRPRDMSLTEYTGFAIKEFKRFARRHNVHLVVAAHPAKMRPIENDGGERRYAVPTLYDISDSSHWANKADIGMVVWRGMEKGAQINRIRIAKSRYHDQIGIPGDVDVTFNPDTNRFEATDTEGSRADEDAA